MESSRRELLNDMAEQGLSWKITKIRNTPLFLKIDLFSATSMESSRRDRSNDMAEHRPILKNNQETHYSAIFQDRPTLSHASIESSRREYLNDVAEHRPLLKNNYNTYHPRFGFTLKTGIVFLKTWVLFLLWGGLSLQLTIAHRGGGVTREWWLKRRSKSGHVSSRDRLPNYYFFGGKHICGTVPLGIRS